MELRNICAAIVSAVLAASCGGGGGGGGGDATAACGVEGEKQLVLDTTRNAYLFLELLPASIDPAQFATADALLDAMTATARAQQKDRFFSFLTSISSEQQFFASAESIGFGITRIETDRVNDIPTRVFVTQVFDGSAAFDAGFRRGDEILQVGTTAATLVDVRTLLQTPTGFTDALGPNETGVTRVFRVRTRTGQEVERVVAKRAFSLDPVPDAFIIGAGSSTPVGYVNLRTFVSPADNLLRNAFAQFRAPNNNVRNVIIDLRYNGGGLVSTAEILGSLLAQQAATSSSIMHRTQFNARRATIDVRFRQEGEAIEPVTIAFLTTNASASASELVINSLSPYARTVIVGEATFGKPVGQEAFDLQGCDTRLRLVSFKSVNSLNYGDYYTGLQPGAGFTDDFCPAPDDLSRDQGDPSEGMTAAALAWINGGACPAPATQKLGAAPATAFSGQYPELPRRPTPPQVYQPGFM